MVGSGWFLVCFGLFWLILVGFGWFWFVLVGFGWVLVGFDQFLLVMVGFGWFWLVLDGFSWFLILRDPTPFALPLLLLLVSAPVSTRWVIGLSRLVGVASGGFSRGWRHVWIGHRNSVASNDAKLGSVGDVPCVWRLFVAVSCGKTASWLRIYGVRASWLRAACSANLV